MAETITLERAKSTVRIMDFQIRIVTNFASDLQGVVASRKASAGRGSQDASVPWQVSSNVKA